MTQSQLQELILELYSSRPEMKEYFEFYLNPDVAALREKHYKLIDKELRRSKWGMSKARVSKLKQTIKKFESFSPGFEAVADFYLVVANRMILDEGFVRFSDTLFNFMAFAVKKYLEIMDRNLMLDKGLANVEKHLMNNSGATRRMRTLVKEAVDNYLQEALESSIEKQ